MPEVQLADVEALKLVEVVTEQTFQLPSPTWLRRSLTNEEASLNIEVILFQGFVPH